MLAVVMVGDGATDLEARDCYDGQVCSLIKSSRTPGNIFDIRLSWQPQLGAWSAQTDRRRGVGMQGGADVMVGYGGNVVRGKVEAGADWFVKDFQLLIRALDSEEPETRAA
eukprot:1863099-Rhodomonas_salina.2